jgi:hypothetical protein
MFVTSNRYIIKNRFHDKSNIVVLILHHKYMYSFSYNDTFLEIDGVCIIIIIYHYFLRPEI